MIFWSIIHTGDYEPFMNPMTNIGEGDVRLKNTFIQKEEGSEPGLTLLKMIMIFLREGLKKPNMYFGCFGGSKSQNCIYIF